MSNDTDSKKTTENDASFPHMMDPELAGIYIGGRSSPISPVTLAKWRVIGCGPRFVKLGRGRSAPVRYQREDLDAFLAKNLHLSTTGQA